MAQTLHYSIVKLSAPIGHQTGWTSMLRNEVFEHDLGYGNGVDCFDRCSDRLLRCFIRDDHNVPVPPIGHSHGSHTVDGYIVEGSMRRDRHMESSNAGRWVRMLAFCITNLASLAP